MLICTRTYSFIERPVSNTHRARAAGSACFRGEHLRSRPAVLFPKHAAHGRDSQTPHRGGFSAVASRWFFLCANCTKNPPTPCLWQAPASPQKTRRKPGLPFFGAHGGGPAPIIEHGGNNAFFWLTPAAEFVELGHPSSGRRRIHGTGFKTMAILVEALKNGKNH